MSTAVSRPLVLLLLFAAVALVLTVAATPAQAAFLCPVVGEGVLNAPGMDGKSFEVQGDYSYPSFLPGNNQAGAHANANALNTQGPGDAPPPGNGNSDWSPIWPN